MHLASIHFPTLPVCPLPLQCHPPQKKIQEKKRRKEKNLKTGQISSWKLLRDTVNHAVNLCPYFFACKCSLQRVIGLVQGPLVSATLLMLGPHGDFSGISCGCPASWRSYTLVLQDPPLLMLQQVTDGVDIGVG